MALLRWDDEEEKKQEDELSPRPSTSIASVQSTWQPVSDTEGAQGGNQQPNNDNYLMSEEKAMADQRLQQRREAEAAAQAEAQRQAAIARENSTRAQAAEEAAQQAQQAQQEQSYKPKDAGEAIGDFFQGLGEGLWKGGAGLVGSGASLVSSIVSGDAENAVTKATRDWQKSADDWGNSVHADGAGEFLGTLPGGIVSGILDPANYMIRGVRNTPEMLAASIAAGSSDANLSKVGTEMQKEIQARQFGEDVAKNGDGAMLMEGIAKPGEMILNVVTAGGASVPLRVSEQAYKEIAKTAAKEGIINVAGGVPLSVLEQAARGQEITPESVAEDAFLQGAVGATIGGISKGYTISKNRSGTSKDASILERELTPLERAAEDDNISFQQKNGTPVADGVVTPVATGAPQYTPIADGTVRSEPLTEAPDQLNGQTPPDWDEVTAREVAAVREQPAPETPAAADGVTQPVRPVENMPTIPTEQVRALQEARAGTTQAEEAVINQELQQIRDNTPAIDDRSFDNATADDNAKIAEFSRIRRESGSDEALYDTLANYEGSNPWLRSAASYVGRMHEGQGVPLKDLFDEIAEPLPSVAETRAANQTDARTQLVKTIRDLEKSTGQTGLSQKVAQAMRGMDEQQQVDFMTKAVTDMRDRGVLAADFVNRENGNTPARSEAPTMIDDTLTDARAPRESEIADNIEIRELDNALESIRQRRAQMIAEGRSENYHGVKQLDKAADLIIREQEKIANSMRADLSSRSESRFTPDESRGSEETLTWEDPSRTVVNDGAEAYRQTSIDNYERYISDMERRGSSQRHIQGLRQNLETLKSAKANEAYWVNPSTGKAEVHPSSELLGSFSKYIGEDVPPIVIGNAMSEGRVPVPRNYSRANATYMAKMSRLDYKNKNSVYHETMHHIDHFIRGYEGKNAKMLELRKLRDDIPVEEMIAFKAGDSRAKNKAEYVAHAMDSLLDGRIKAGELGKATMRYIKKFFSSVKEALSSGHVYGFSHDGVKLADYVKKLDAVIHDGKAPNQKPLSKKELTPTTKNLPQVMQPKGKAAPIKAPAEPKPKKTVSDWAKRVYSQTDLHKDMKRRLAAALGKEKDAELPIGELLSGTKVSAKDRSAITERYNTLEKLSKEFNKLMQSNRKLFEADNPESIRKGISQLDEETSRKANKLIDAYGRAERDLNGYVRKVQGKRSLAHRGVNALQNITGARNASLLSSVGGIERNISQEFGANLLDAVMHPVKYVKGLPQLAPEVLRSYKRAFREYTVKPKTLSEALPYAIGNTYRVLMAPVTGQANYRKSIMRETLAESLLRAEGLDPTRAEIKKFAGSMGADSEVVANNLAGIMNGMTSHTNGLKVMQNYQEFIHTGSAEAKEAFMKNAERSSNLAAKLSRVGAESDNPKVRAAASLMNIVMPFVTTATNMAKTAATYNFNPMARSVPDEVMKAVRSNPANALALLKANAVKGGVLAGVYGLYAAGVVQYNNGDEVDKPKGISIDLGNGEFFPVRGTPIEVPIAAVVAAGMIADDVADGKVKNWSYYGGILGNSLPYIDSTNNMGAAIISGLDAAFGGNADQGTGDNGYAAKSYAVNMAKSFVPYSNNGVQPGVNAWQGKSTNAKSTYDKDTGKWFSNSVRQAYDPAFRDSLKDSRDASGRVRTVDQQGGFRTQKGINDELTKVHNDSIDNLVKYGRDNGLGRGTQDMFNTYDTGKNNNFKGVQDAITFLDAEVGADGKKSPKAEDKLKNNEKLADLAVQIRDGFWGDTGDTLLMLGDQQLYSDVSVPNKNGTKNSRLPLNMQSIKNAIAAADLPEEQRNRIYEISQANQALYARRQAGEITYDEEQAMKAQSEQEYVDILSNSENYKKMNALMVALDEQGFFNVGGLGSTKAGQTYLWNSLNALLGSKGATPAAQWDSGAKSGWGSRGSGGGGSRAIYKPTNRGVEGMKWAPVGKRKMADVNTGKYTPLQIKVKLGNAVKKNKTQDYSDRSF